MSIEQYAEEIFKGHTMRKDYFLDGYYFAIDMVCEIIEKHMSEGYISPPTEYIKATLEAFRKDMEEIK